jgi:hypothetical protein
MSDQNVDAVLAELNAIKAQREKRTTMRVGFAWGFLAGTGLAVAVTFLLVVPKVKSATEAIHQVGKANTEIASQRNLLAASAQKCQEQLAALETPEASSPAFTLLYDPAPAGAQDSSAAQLLDMVRPGLGSLLSKMQKQTGPSGPPRWLVPGFTKPIVNGDSQGFYYQWVNLDTHDVETHTPKGTIVR